MLIGLSAVLVWLKLLERKVDLSLASGLNKCMSGTGHVIQDYNGTDLIRLYLSLPTDENAGAGATSLHVGYEDLGVRRGSDQALTVPRDFAPSS